MKRTTNILVLVIILFDILQIVAQTPINKGFEFLEKGNFKAAETFFEDFLKENPNNKTAKLCYGRAIGLNGNVAQATIIFDELLQDEPQNLEFLLNRAEAFLWADEAKNGLSAYTAIIENSKNHNNKQQIGIAYLGLGNSHSKLQQYKLAIKAYLKALELAPKVLGTYISLSYTYVANNQKHLALAVIEDGLSIAPENDELQKLKTKLQNELKVSIDYKVSTMYDSGKTRSYLLFSQLNIPVNTKLKLHANYEFKESNNTRLDLSSNSTQLQIGLSYLLTNKITVTSQLGYNSVAAFSNEYSDWLGDFSTTYKPNERHTLTLGIQKTYHDFNAELMNLEIDMKHLFIAYHHLSKHRYGIYTQLYRTWQSDNNSRDLLFSSLYYLWNKKLGLKSGINYQFLQFSEQRPLDYFSPEKFHLTEVFSGFETRFGNNRFLANGLLAIGYQFIEDTDKQGSFRAQGAFGYEAESNMFQITCYGLFSNLAASNAAGFSYNEIGIKGYLKF